MSDNTNENPPMPQKEVYLIDLNKIYDNQPNREWPSKVEDKNGSMSLHRNLASRLTRNIWNAVWDNDKSCAHDWKSGWSNLNYFISGERGSGKSTFLRYVTRCITGKLSPFVGKEEAYKEDSPLIAQLFFCDPTAMTSNENFFISIVAAFKEWLKAQTKEELIRKECYELQGMSIPENERRFDDKINKLARGIRQLNDGSSSSQAHLDPVSQLSMGMTNSSSALKLKEQFDALVNDIAKAYETKAFLIAIDDADIEFTKNKEIIEIIRTYLTHPRLIILFTGDTILTHEAIREKQFGQFGLEFHKTDIANQKRRWELADAMTAQYIKKIFPPSNHLHLTSLYDTVREHDDKYVFMVGYDSADKRKKEELVPFLNRLFTQVLDSKPQRAELLTEGFMRLPLRSIMHILRYWWDRQIYELLRHLESMLDDHPEKEGRQRDIAQLLSKSFRSAFTDELLSIGFNKTELEMQKPFQLARGLLLHCFNSKDVTYGHRLVVNACRYDNQESTFFLAAKTALIVRDFGDALTFALFGVFTVHAYRYYRQTCMDAETQPNIANYDFTKVEQYLRHKQQGFVDYLFVSNNEDPLRWMRKLSLIFLMHQEKAIAWGDSSQFFLSHGVYYLSDKDDIALVNQVLGNLRATILSSWDDFKTMTREEREEKLRKSEESKRNAFKVYLLLLISCAKASNLQNVYYLSAFNIFGFILQCYRECQEGENTKSREYRIAGLIRQFISSSIEANDMPAWGGSFPMPRESGDIQFQSLEENGNLSLIDDMAGKIVAWYEKRAAVKPHFAYDVALAADGIYHLICDVTNALQSSIRSGLASSDMMPLYSLFTRLVSFVPHQTKDVEAAELAECVGAFPLCDELYETSRVLRLSARSVATPTVFSTSIKHWMDSLNNNVETNEKEIAYLKRKIEGYFVRFGHSDEDADSQQLLFGNSPEHTVDESQRLVVYLSRIQECLVSMKTAIVQCAKSGKRLKIFNQGEYITLSRHVFEESSKFWDIRREASHFREKIQEVFISELEKEIASAQARFRVTDEKYKRSLKTLLRKMRKDADTKNLFSSLSPEDELGGFMNPLAMKNDALTVMAYYADWKRVQEMSKRLKNRAHEWISTLRDNPNMTNLCEKLHITSASYSTFFKGYDKELTQEPAILQQQVESVFEDYANLFRYNLNCLAERIRVSIGHYQTRLEAAAVVSSEQLEVVRDKILGEVGKLEASVHVFQDVLIINEGDEGVMRMAPRLNIKASFETEFDLRKAFYGVYIALFDAQRHVEFYQPEPPTPQADTAPLS